MSEKTSRNLVRAGRPCLFLVALVVLAACSEGRPKPLGSKQPRSEAPVSVRVATVVQKTIPVQIPAIGTVEPKLTVAVRAQLEGILERVHFREGQDVKTSDVLFTIDARPYEAALAQAEANLARDRIQAENAKKDAERDAALFRKGILSGEEHDRALANAAALEAAARADLAAVETTKVKLSYCTIRSPLDGRTGDLRVDAGNLVRSNDVLVTIVQISPIEVAFWVPEQELPRIRAHMAKGTLKVEAIPPTQDSHPAAGELSFVDNTVDKTLGTIQLKGTFPNKDKALWPGQFVDVALTLTEQPNVIVVPGQAVQTGQQGQYVYVVKSDSRAELRPVVVDRVFDNEAIVLKGLAPGESVVTDGHLRLVNGAPVRIPDAAAAQQTSHSLVGMPAPREKK